MRGFILLLVFAWASSAQPVVDGTPWWQKRMNEAYLARQKGDAGEASRLVAETWEAVRRAGPALENFAQAVEQITQWHNPNHGVKAEGIFEAALKLVAPLGESHPIFQQLLLGQAQFYVNRQQEVKAVHTYERVITLLEHSDKADPWTLQAARAALASR